MLNQQKHESYKENYIFDLVIATLYEHFLKAFQIVYLFLTFCRTSTNFLFFLVKDSDVAT